LRTLPYCDPISLHKSVLSRRTHLNVEPPSSHRALIFFLDSLTKYSSGIALMRLLVSPLKQCILSRSGCSKKGSTCIDFKVAECRWLQTLFEEGNCPMETNAPIARTRSIGCAMGFKYLVVDPGLSVVLEPAQNCHMGGQLIPSSSLVQQLSR
jgi:hypothetical protein